MSMSVESPIDIQCGKHTGERCWVVGSGPSLDKVNLRRLPRTEDVYALNATITLLTSHPRAWWFFRDRRICFEIGPQRLASWKRWRVVTHRKALEMVKDRRMIPRGRSMVAYLYNQDSIIHRRTVLEDTLQIVKFMGYDEVVLVGIDHAIINDCPYAKALAWKDCHFHNPNPDGGVKGVKPIEAMVAAMEQLAPTLAPLRVVNTSRSYPRKVFEYKSFKAVLRAREPACS
jgi:hypothetical protein